MVDQGRPWGLMLGCAALAVGLALAMPAAPPPRSKPRRVNVVMNPAPVAMPGIDALAERYPEIAALSQDQRRLVAVALARADAPCAPCAGKNPQPISVCAMAQTAGCENLDPLVRRAARLAASGADGDALLSAVLYGDVWVPAAARHTVADQSTIPVELWLDLSSPLLADTLSTAGALHGAEIQAQLWVRPALDPDARALGPLEQAALGAESLGKLLELADCWVRAPKPASDAARAGEQELFAAIASVCPEAPTEKWWALGASLVSAGATEVVVKDGVEHDLRSAPTWFVNGYRMRGLQSAGAIQRLIDRELAD